MSQCIDKLPHSCGTKKGLQVFVKEDGVIDGFCFSCSTYVENPYGEPKTASDVDLPKPKSEEEIQAEIQEVLGYPSLPSKALRKMSAEAYDSYDVKFGLSEEDGTTVNSVYFPYTKDFNLIGWKARTLTKPTQYWVVGTTKDADLFGWQQALQRKPQKLIIVEGEFDAIALDRALLRHTKAEYIESRPAVVSLPTGAGSAHNYLSKRAAEIRTHFHEENIILCFDMDKPGQDALEKCMLVFPTAKAATLPSKDANDALMQGKSQALYNSVTFHSATPKNTRIVFAEDLHESAKEETKWGELSWPWAHVNETTRGIRYGETIFIGAGVKMGKSELLNELAAHFIKEHDVKVFMAKPEEANKKTYKLLANKIEGKVFHDPKIAFDADAFDKAGDVLKGRLAMINLYQHVGWESLKADIVSAVNWGAKVVFIDPITNLTNGINAGEANEKLQEIAQDLAALAMNHNIAIFIFCHLKAHDGNISKEARLKAYKEGKFIGLGNCPHELGGDIFSTQFAGSRAMMRSCNYMFGLEGNKDEALDLSNKNIRHLKLLEDREFGESGVFPLFWNKDTTLFKEFQYSK